ncbi:MAG TPA: hypothetical protein VGU71_13150 [Candidatus Dormibacteraeota bacterium]|nr:hypothetical protein [Candidatus Dormibacteraeota bacterium]
MEGGRLLIAIGLTVWLGGLVAAVAYTRRHMRFPKSMYARYSWFPSRYRAIAGLLLFAAAAYWEPMVAWVATVFASGLVIYAMGAYVIALTYERRRAMRRGLPEPGTAGTISFAESAVFLSIAVLCAIVALALTVCGIANEIGGNRGEGGGALVVGAMAWFLAIVMGLVGSPLLLFRRRR